MNESRRKEIADLAKKLRDIQSQLRQIRVADSVAKNPPDKELSRAILNIDCARQDLNEALL